MTVNGATYHAARGWAFMSWQGVGGERDGDFRSSRVFVLRAIAIIAAALRT